MSLLVFGCPWVCCLCLFNGAGVGLLCLSFVTGCEWFGFLFGLQFGGLCVFFMVVGGCLGCLTHEFVCWGMLL